MSKLGDHKHQENFLFRVKTALRKFLKGANQETVILLRKKFFFKNLGSPKN